MLKRFDKIINHFVLFKKTFSSKKNSFTKFLSILSKSFDLHFVVQKFAINQLLYKTNEKRFNRSIEIDKKKLSNEKLNNYFNQIFSIIDSIFILLSDSLFSIDQINMINLN